MQTALFSTLPPPTRIRTRSALVASADRSFRQRLGEILTGLRWQVREADSGAQAWAEAEAIAPEAVVVDSWLPDLELAEFPRDLRKHFPDVDLLTTGAASSQESPRPLSAGASVCAAPQPGYRYRSLECGSGNGREKARPPANAHPRTGRLYTSAGWGANASLNVTRGTTAAEIDLPTVSHAKETGPSMSHPRVVCERLPELVGNAPCMLEVSRRVRLVAPRSTPELIEGPTGSGKELVAEALHRLSSRSRKPFVAINCAAIPEALLEAELFGHTRGAFTGAVQGRTGRIESADGGTLFLDEIGEMPLGLQSKLLRFVECGELQRVGDNETVRVDVRIIAATHQALAQQTQSGNFRSDLYYRLAVFLIRTPSLGDHSEDLPLLVEHFLEQ